MLGVVAVAQLASNPALIKPLYVRTRRIIFSFSFVGVDRNVSVPEGLFAYPKAILKVMKWVFILFFTYHVYCIKLIILNYS